MQWLFVVVALSCLALACGGGGAANGGGAVGGVELVAHTSSALTSGDVAKVTLTVSGAGIATPIVNDLTKIDGAWTGTIGNIPAGTGRALHADAYNASNVVVYTGDAQNVEIDDGATAVVAMLLQQATAPTPFTDAVPVIDSFVATSNAVAPTRTVSLNVAAHDTDASDALTYAWTATGGTFSTVNALATTWTAPGSEGAQTLTIKVSDAKGEVAAMSLTVSVAATNGSGTLAVTTSFNTWPLVSDVVASPTRVDAGETTTVTATASDPDGDTLTYAWTSACAGTFGAASAAATSFTLASPVAGATCALTVTTTDGRGGTNTGTLTIQTGPQAPARFTPQIDGTYQSATVARPSDVLTFKVKAHDPQGQALTFAWTASTGTLGAPTNTSNESDVTWTFPNACQASAATITLTITDAGGLATTQKFTVASDTQSDPSNCGACGKSCNGFACSNGQCNLSPGWKVMSSKLTTVAAGGASVWLGDWAPGGTGTVYQSNGDGTFSPRNNGRSALSVTANGTPFVLSPATTANNAAYWSGLTFTGLTGTLTQLTAGGTTSNVWGLNGTSVFKYDGNSSFVAVSGTLASIAAGGTATWGLSPANNALRWDGTQFTDSGAVLPGGLTVTQSGVAWGFDGSHEAFFWNGTSFVDSGKALVNVAGASDGTTWGVDAAGMTYLWDGAKWNAKTTAPVGQIAQVAVGRTDVVWAADPTSKHAYNWTACVAPKGWSGSASVCCSGVWASANTCQ